jgi:hypothetical protein
MLMSPDDFRRIALEMEGASEGEHMGHPDFRVGGKIFATLHYPDSDSAVVLLDREQQSAFVASAPRAFAPVKGGWGLRGSTQVTLSAADESTVRDAIETAWRRRAPQRTRPRPSKR